MHIRHSLIQFRRRVLRVDLDVRSLALFRILLGVYLLVETVWGRLSLGKYDMAWYTSTPDSTSYLEATDTPHKAPLHQIWFYRGSAELQYCLFGVTAVVAACFALGYCCNGMLKVLVFILMTAQQSRNAYVHDGSDTFARHLLLWSCFLPLAETWSVDAYLQRRKRRSSRSTRSNKKTDDNDNDPIVTKTISTLPAYAICLQIVLMYWGPVLGRTTDLYSFSELGQSEWLPPQLSAVHYALSGSFAVRDNPMNDLIRSHPILGQILTASSMLVEGFVAPLCFLFPKHRHWFAAVMVALHAGLLLHLRLPQWQCIAILAQTLWIPSHVWDSLLQVNNCEVQQQQITVDENTYKKTDGDHQATGAEIVAPRQPQRRLRIVRRVRNNRHCHIVSRILQAFFFVYMIYNWAGERRWITKHDDGDIGEGLRLSQYWVMYAELGHTAHMTILTGILSDSRRVDLFRYIQTGEMVDAVSDVKTFVPHDMSRRYPSARWERALDGWATASYDDTPEYGRQRGRQFCKALCVLINQDRYAARQSGLRQIELRFQHLTILPPGSYPQRYEKKRAMEDTVVTVSCKPLPSPLVPSPPSILME
jgi:hypothetical protein